jgi:hypothetical protein
MTCIRGRLFVLHVVIAAHLCVGSLALAQPDAEVLRWAQQILLGPEYGGEGRICSRWVKGPTLSVLGATPEEQKVIAATVTHLNATLANTVNDAVGERTVAAT